MARDRAEIPADISTVQSLIRHDLDVAGARMRRPLLVAGALVVPAVIAGIGVARLRLIPVLRSGLAAGLVAYRVISVLASAVEWLDPDRRPSSDHRAGRKHWPERDTLFPRREARHGNGTSQQRVIVAATDLPLYHALRAVLGGREGVDVVLDRRRSNGTAWPASERRVRPDVDAELRSTGWARVVLPRAS
jgi:hypothetical protein